MAKKSKMVKVADIDLSRIPEATTVVITRNNGSIDYIEIGDLLDEDERISIIEYSEIYNYSDTIDPFAYRYTDRVNFTVLKVLLPINTTKIDFLKDGLSVLSEELCFYETDENGNITYYDSYYHPDILSFTQLKTKQEKDPSITIHENRKTAHKSDIVAIMSELQNDSFAAKDLFNFYQNGNQSTKSVNNYLIGQDFDIFYCGTLLKEDDDNLMDGNGRPWHVRADIGAHNNILVDEYVDIDNQNVIHIAMVTEENP